MLVRRCKSEQYEIIVKGESINKDEVDELLKANYNSVLSTLTKFANITDGFPEQFTIKIKKEYKVIEVFNYKDEFSLEWTLLIMHKDKPQVMVRNTDYHWVEPEFFTIYQFTNDLYAIKLARYIMRNRFGIYKTMIPIIDFINTMSIISVRNPVKYDVEMLEERHGFTRVIGVKSTVFYNSNVVQSEKHDFILSVKDSWLKGLNVLTFLEDFL